LWFYFLRIFITFGIEKPSFKSDRVFFSVHTKISRYVIGQDSGRRSLAS